jgi:hypothetical protein
MLSRSVRIEHRQHKPCWRAAVAFTGRPPSTPSLIARSPGKLTKATAEYWAGAGETACHHQLMPSSEPSGWVGT